MPLLLKVARMFLMFHIYLYFQGCSFGYHAGGWGKPPVDENGKPLYGDVFGVQGAEVIVSIAVRANLSN